MKAAATLADVLEMEKEEWSADLPASTYEMIQRSAARNPNAPALSFFFSADALEQAEVFTGGPGD